MVISGDLLRCGGAELMEDDGHLARGEGFAGVFVAREEELLPEVGVGAEPVHEVRDGCVR